MAPDVPSAGGPSEGCALLGQDEAAPRDEAERSRGPEGPRPSVTAAALGSVALAAVGDAARQAVAAAFADLRPALLQAVSASCAEVVALAVQGGRGKRSSTEPQKLSGFRRSRVTSGASQRTTRGSEHALSEGRRVRTSEARSSCRSNTSATVVSNKSSVVGASTSKYAFHSEASSRSVQLVAKLASKASRESIVSVAQGRASVHCVEAALAQTLLEQCGFVRDAPRPPPPRPPPAEGPPHGPAFLQLMPGASEHADGHAVSARRRIAGDEAGRSSPSPVPSSAHTEEEEEEAEPSSDESSRRGSADGGRSMNDRNRRRHLTSAQVLQLRVQQLAQEASRVDDAPYHNSLDPMTQEATNLPDLVESVVPASLKLPGVMPWSHQGISLAYMWCVRGLLLVGLVAFCVWSLWGAGLSSSRAGGIFTCGRDAMSCLLSDGLLSQLPLPFGAILVVAVLGRPQQQKALTETFFVLQRVSDERGYSDWHARRDLFDKIVFITLWVCISVSHALCIVFQGEHDERPTPGRAAFGSAMVALFSALILGPAHGMVYVCRSLSIMIDTFCCDLVGNMELADIAHVWNMTQAVLRQASNSTESGFLALCLILAFTVPMLVVDIGLLGDISERVPVPTLLPGLLVTCGVFYVLLLASTISEKCSRVPALINAISFGDGTERARQHTVDYISSSAAGFYIFGVRLTTSMVVKLMYVWCIVAVGLLTRMGPT